MTDVGTFGGQLLELLERMRALQEKQIELQELQLGSFTANLCRTACTQPGNSAQAIASSTQADAWKPRGHGNNFKPSGNTEPPERRGEEEESELQSRYEICLETSTIATKLETNTCEEQEPHGRVENNQKAEVFAVASFDVVYDDAESQVCYDEYEFEAWLGCPGETTRKGQENHEAQEHIQQGRPQEPEDVHRGEAEASISQCGDAVPDAELELFSYDEYDFGGMAALTINSKESFAAIVASLKAQLRVSRMISFKSSHKNELPPVVIPGNIRLMLIIMTVLPSHHIKNSHWRYLYRNVYSNLFLAACLTWGFVNIAIACGAVLPSGDLPVVEIVVLISFLLITPLLLSIYRKQFGPSGIILSLMQEMSELGYPWEHVKAALLAAWCAALSTWISFHSFRLAQYYFHHRSDKQYAAEAFVAVQNTIVHAYVLEACVSILPIIWMYGALWVVYFFCTLHKFDLMCYVVMLQHVLQSIDDHGSDRLLVLKELEAKITHRFRHTSTGLVRYLVGVLMVIVLMALMILSFMLATPRLSWVKICLCVLCLIICFVIAGFVSGHLASVAECFEYDVLRRLNNMETLNRALPQIGDQFLDHITLLEWGFRFGGTVITPRFATVILSALAITVVTSVTQTISGRIALA